MDYQQQRRQAILQQMKPGVVITISKLCEMLNMTPSTVRRDLKKLEEQHKITSFHGGVSLNEGYGSFGERIEKFSAEKQRIGRAAAQLVSSGELIYLGGGSTVFEMAKSLAQRTDLRNVTVVVSAINIAAQLLGGGAFRVVIPCGEMESPDESMMTGMTLGFLSSFYFDKAFLGTQAISAERGYQNPSLPLNELKKFVIERTKETVVLCDHSKIGKNAPYQACSFDKIGTLMTDSAAESAEEIGKMREMGANIASV